MNVSNFEKMFAWGFALLVLFPAGIRAAEERTYELLYTVELLPEQAAARVSLTIPDARLLKKLDFNLSPDLHAEVTGNGELVLENGRAVWTPPERDARLQWLAHINQERQNGRYDALITPAWSIFRGDDLVPPARVRSVAGAESVATLRFKLPPKWPTVNTGWESLDNTSFRIDNPERRFDRPIGWMIAGDLGTRRELLGKTRVAVSAPKGSALHRMDVLSFITFIWPEMEAAFGSATPQLLLVGAGDPMWRGGLSAPNSLFLHADRPLVSENGTSTLIHELVHVVSGIRGARNDDWIAEGLAEFYAVELLYRAGGLTGQRRERVFADLREWGQDVETLRQRRSTGATTARAAVLFLELDEELREHGSSLDLVARELMKANKVALEDLRAVCHSLMGRTPKTLQSPVLAEP